jgi:DNA-directed RNA polymerase specialized sigma24 family protein
MRPKRTSLDPASFERGEIARQTAVEVRLGGVSRPVGMVLQELVASLPQPDRSAVQLVTMEGLSLYEAAEIMEVELGYLADSKTIWRWARRGEKRLRKKLEKIGIGADYAY